jgi:hypothetical protein
MCTLILMLCSLINSDVSPVKTYVKEQVGKWEDRKKTAEFELRLINYPDIEIIKDLETFSQNHCNWVMERRYGAHASQDPDKQIWDAWYQDAQWHRTYYNCLRLAMSKVYHWSARASYLNDAEKMARDAGYGNQLPPPAPVYRFLEK